jgi:hypothetical protein
LKTDKKFVIIETAEYINLLTFAEELFRLHIGGVNLWDKYQESVNPYGKISLSEFKEVQRKNHGIYEE